jgi:small subunit ribosomal protein S5
MAIDPTSAPSTGGNAPGKGGRERRERRDDRQQEKSPYTERVVFINRVSSPKPQNPINMKYNKYL